MSTMGLPLASKESPIPSLKADYEKSMELPKKVDHSYPRPMQSNSPIFGIGFAFIFALVELGRPKLKKESLIPQGF